MRPPVQALLHVPQFSASVIVLTQPLPHWTVGAEQLEVQPDGPHSGVPAPHTVPHAPQCMLFDFGSTQTLLQDKRPAPQVWPVPPVPPLSSSSAGVSGEQPQA
jgi:hypothetical protein